jgi:hypothetical protein
MITDSQSFIGILMLETRFPRLLGDVGNPLTFNFPVRYKVVRGASPESIIHRQAEGMLPAFIDAALALQDEGACAITTTCGFLAQHQNELQARLHVPMLSSSLLLLPALQRRFGMKSVGILTIDALALKRLDLPATVLGMAPDTEFASKILGNCSEFNPLQCEVELVGTALQFVAEQASLGTPLVALLLECTNMAVHQDAIALATQLPIFSLNQLLEQFWAAKDL